MTIEPLHASFLCPKRQRNEAKKALSNHATLSVHSVQFLFMGAPKARCSPEPRMCELELTRFRGHLFFRTGGVHYAETSEAVPGGIPGADG